MRTTETLDTLQEKGARESSRAAAAPILRLDDMEECVASSSAPTPTPPVSPSTLMADAPSLSLDGLAEPPAPVSPTKAGLDTGLLFKKRTARPIEEEGSREALFPDNVEPRLPASEPMPLEVLATSVSPPAPERVHEDFAVNLPPEESPKIALDEANSLQVFKVKPSNPRTTSQKKKKAFGLSALFTKAGTPEQSNATERLEPVLRSQSDAESQSTPTTDANGEASREDSLGKSAPAWIKRMKDKATSLKKRKIAKSSSAVVEPDLSEVKHTAFQRALAAALPSLYKLPALKAESISKKRGPVSRRLSGSLPILVELDGGDLVYYTVTASTLAQVDSFELDKAASFSSDDRRFLVDSTTTYQRAIDIVLSDGISEDVRIVNMAKTLGTVHGTSLERINESELAVGPGLLLVEFALLKVQRPKVPHVICILLKDSESPRSLAILYHSNPEGDIDAPQISVNPSNLGFTLAQFQSSRGLPADVPIIQLNNEDLMAVASEFRLYPQEGMWNGIPISRMLWAAAGVSMVAAVALTGNAVWNNMNVASYQKQASQLRYKAQELDVRNERLISTSLVRFGALQSISVEEIYERAAHIWIPRTIMRLVATSEAQNYFISMGMSGGGYFNNRPSVLNQLQNKNVEQLLQLTPPDGCIKQMPGVSGGVNVIQITVTCENFVGSIGRYRVN